MPSRPLGSVLIAGSLLLVEACASAPEPEAESAPLTEEEIRDLALERCQGQGGRGFSECFEDTRRQIKAEEAEKYESTIVPAP